MTTDKARIHAGRMDGEAAMTSPKMDIGNKINLRRASDEGFLRCR